MSRRGASKAVAGSPAALGGLSCWVVLPLLLVPGLGTMAELKSIKLVDDKPDALIFCGKNPQKPHDFRHSWERVLAELGIPYMPFHAMRHSTASHAAKNGASTIMLMNLLGHTSPKMSARYSHFAVSDKAEFIHRIF